MDHPYGIVFAFPVVGFYKMDHPYGIVFAFSGGGILQNGSSLRDFCFSGGGYSPYPSRRDGSFRPCPIVTPTEFLVFLRTWKLQNGSSLRHCLGFSMGLILQNESSLRDCFFVSGGVVLQNGSSLRDCFFVSGGVILQNGSSLRDCFFVSGGVILQNGSSLRDCFCFFRWRGFSLSVP